jgi:hypothetical protein
MKNKAASKRTDSRSPHRNKDSHYYDNGNQYGTDMVWGCYQISKKPADRATKVKRAKSSFQLTKGGPKKCRGTVFRGLLFDDKDNNEYHTAKHS